MGEPQIVLDTRALELASEARTLAREAREECRSEYKGLRDEFREHRAETGESISALRTAIGEGFAGVNRMLWGVAAGVIAVLLAVIGFLFAAAYPVRRAAIEMWWWLA